MSMLLGLTCGVVRERLYTDNCFDCVVIWELIQWLQRYKLDKIFVTVATVHSSHEYE